MNDEEILARIIEEAKRDPNILGLYLSGSRGKGLPTKYSDYDIEIVVKDKVAKRYKLKFKRRKIKNFGFTVYSFSEFKKHAALGTEEEYDRPSFTHVKAIVDKLQGKIQKLIDEKGKLPKKQIKTYVSERLDAFINYIYRSLKCIRDKNYVCARLEAARAIQFFFEIIFGLEGRVAPYYKYLQWELKNYPLKKFPLKPKQIIKSVLKILENADAKTQRRLFRIVEKVFRREGYGSVFDSWGEEALKFLRGEKKNAHHKNHTA